MKILDVPQSGSVAGVTSSRNRYGQYRRTRAVPVNPNTSAQQSSRSALSVAAQAWRGLTDVQRAAWSTYAGANPVVDSLGQSQNLTGLQAYVSVNSRLSGVGYPAVTDPPAGDAPATPTLVVDETALGDLSTVITPNPVTAGHKMLIESSPPLSAGREFTSDFRKVATYGAASIPDLGDFALETKWGTLAEGQKLFLRARLIAATGAASGWATTSFVFSAPL